MKEKSKFYYLTNAEFDVQISKGMIISMKRTGDSYQTQYADEKLGFGGICVHIQVRQAWQQSDFPIFRYILVRFLFGLCSSLCFLFLT